MVSHRFRPFSVEILQKIFQKWSFSVENLGFLHDPENALLFARQGEKSQFSTKNAQFSAVFSRFSIESGRKRLQNH